MTVTEAEKELLLRVAQQINDEADHDHLISVLLEHEEARAIAHARQPGEPVAKKPFVGWYCPHCQRGVDSREVTFSEQHEVCGTYIGDAEPPASWEETVQYAERLAASLHAKHFPENASWRPLSGDLIGLLTQIDNMTADLVRSAPPALPAPVAVPDGDRAKMAANLVSIADASRRADGSDIPLGETLRKAAAMLAAPSPASPEKGTERMREALEKIEGGHLPGLVDLVLAGDWPGAFDLAQACARAALASLPAEPEGETCPHCGGAALSPDTQEAEQ